MAGTLETSSRRPGPVRRAWEARPGPARTLFVAACSVVMAAGLVLRFYAPTPLWLDETISVNIARLPIGQIHAALRQDGAPPLYYVMLHGWMVLFGQGDIAVRALSGITSIVTLPFIWLAGRRLAGRTVAWVALFLTVTSPFAIDYATATRMYSLMVLLSTLGFLALARALERPTRGRLVALGAVVAALLYTHYWALYLVVVVGAWLLYQLWRHRRRLPTHFDRSAVRRCFVACVVGSLTFLPWAPTFVFQSLHTGTPWSSGAGPADVLGVFGDYAGTGPWATLLGFAYFGLVVLGVFGHRLVTAAPATAEGTAQPGDPHGLDPAERDLLAAAGLGADGQGRSLRATATKVADRLVGFAGFGPGGAGAAARREQPGRGISLMLQPNRTTLPVFGVLAGTLVVAMLADAAVQAAFSARYTAVVMPLFILVVAVGIGVLGRGKVLAGIVAVLCVAGLLTGLGNNGQQRTEAAVVAGVLNAQAQPGDLVIYCPDQLGPAVDRLLTVKRLEQLTFPRGNGPARVDWVDYLATISHTDVAAFAQDALASAHAGAAVWLVWSPSYTGFGSRCADLQTWLDFDQGSAGTTVVHLDGAYEREMLTRYPVGGAP